MNLRLLNMSRSNVLAGKRIIVTGCGFKPVQTKFYDIHTKEESHDSIFVNNNEQKLNIGAATAFVLAANGATVHLVSKTENNLKQISAQIIETLNVEESQVEYSAVDILDETEISKFVSKLPKDKPIWWVQSIGLGAGAYKLKDDNPYLHIETIPAELLEKESTVVLKGTHILMQKLLPVFREQNKNFGIETRIAIISSMSAIRGYNLGGTHCAAKGAISRYANSAMLDLYKENIFVTDVRPGAVDTGMYDNKAVQNAVIEIVKNYGNNWKKENEIRLMPPTSIGYIINTIFSVPAHTTSVNMVAKSQFPNEGS